jgi:hypothetical protein
MNKHSFTIVASGLDYEAEDFEDRFFGSGCDDATISVQKGVIILDFNREARSFNHALKSAMVDIESAGAKVIHVEPDHLVSVSDIAARVGLTRSAVSHYAKGKRGTGFPAPVVRVTTESPLWDWVEVARWFRSQGRLTMCELLRARVVRSTNVAIMAREAGHISEFYPGRRKSDCFAA